MSYSKAWTGDNPYDPAITPENSRFVNQGVCQRRLQEGNPSFCIHWQKDGQNCYTFFSIRSALEDFKARLLGDGGIS